MASTVRQLPAEVRSYLRSGVTVTSVTQCIEELLLNALDAGSTCVAVRVNLDIFKIQVVDNGTGIAKDQLNLVGERYATSKCHSIADLKNLQYFGYRGEALASIRESCSVLEMITKIKDSTRTYCKLFQDGNSLEVIESTVPRPSIGTTVTVHDLFSKFPVRRKSTNLSLELEKIRQRIKGLALLKPEVSISLRNDSTGVILLQTHKSTSSLLTFKHLFGGAKASTLSEISGSKNYFTIEGFLGKEGHSKKELQFVYVNGRLVLKTAIHKIVNKMLTNSAILKKKYDTGVSTPVMETKSVFVKSPGRQIERYPVFVLNVKCPLTKYDITFDPSKTLIEFKDWDSLLDLTKEILDTFLKKENLLSVEEKENTSKNAGQSVEAERKSSPDKNLQIPLSKVISPSKMKDTLFSKPVKRKSSETELFKTPVSISIEEWKAENKIRKVVCNDLSSQNTLELSDSETKHCYTMNDNSELSEESQCHIESGHKQRTEVSTLSLNDLMTSDISHEEIKVKCVAEGDRYMNGNLNCVQHANETGDHDVYKKFTKLQNSDNNMTDKKMDLRIQESLDSISNEVKEIGTTEELNVEEPSRKKMVKPVITVTSKSSLSEFRKMIGKPVSTIQKPISVGEKLKTNFSLHGRERNDSMFADNTRQVFDKYPEKYVSSLQKFRKNVPIKSAAGDQELHGNKDNLNTNEYISFHRKESERLCKSGISVVDIREDINNLQNNRNEQYTALNNLENNTYTFNTENNSSRKFVSGRKCSTNRSDENVYDLHLGSNFQNLNRKRQYKCNETKLFASKLSRLSKQKTAVISVSSTCEADKSPIDAEIIREDNSVVSVVKNTEPYTCRTFPFPSCTQTLSSVSEETLPALFTQEQVAPVECLKLGELSNYTKQIAQTFSINNEKLQHQSTCSNDNKRQVVGEFDKAAHQQMNYVCDENSSCNGDNILISDQKSFDPCNTTYAEQLEVPVNVVNKHFEDVSKIFIKDDMPCVYEKTITVNPKTGHSSEGLNFDKVEAVTFMDNTEIEQLKFTACDTISDGDSEPFELATQTFSPKINSTQTGLSQQMTGITISQGLNCKNGREMPVMAMSPCSEGFSPCLPISPKCMSDYYGSDSQGFSARIRESSESDIIEEVHKNGLENSAALLQTASQTSDIQDKGECFQNETEDDSGKFSDSAENSEQKQKSMSQSVNQSGQFSNEIGYSTKPVSKSENDSEDVIATDKTVRISQMLFTESEDDRQANATTASVQTHSKDIHFSDIFTPSLSETTVCSQEIQQIEICEKVSNAKNSNDTIKETENDSLSAQTLDNPEIFLSWDGNYKYNIIQNDSIKVLPPQDKGLDIENTKIADRGEENIIETPSKPNTVSSNSEGESTELSPAESRKKNHEFLSESDSVKISNCSACKIEHVQPNHTKKAQHLAPVINQNVAELTGRSEMESPDPDPKTDTDQKPWIQLKDPQTGKMIYVHSLLGTTVTEAHWKAAQGSDFPEEDVMSDMSKISEEIDKLWKLTPNTTENLQSIVDQFTKVTDDVDDENEEDAFVKWRDSQTARSTETSKANTCSVEDLFAEWKNPVFESADKNVMNMEISNLPKSISKAYSALQSCKFTKEMLNTVKVIGQVDKKFIACLMKTDPSSDSAKPDMLAVIDQHAAHERIRLEFLTEEAYVDCDVDSGILEVYTVDPPKHLELNPEEVRIMTSYKQEFSRIGVNFYCDTQSRNVIIIETIPACIMEKDVNYVKSTRETVAWNIVQALLKEHVDLLVSTGGAGKRFPVVLHKCLCSQACHGAIKFGDKLSLRECEALIKDLSRCDLPFQCAHGRPSVMPILQLGHLRTKLPQEKQRRPQLYKLSNAIQREQTTDK